MFARPKQRKVGAIAVRLTTPENIRTLQRKLYQKAKQGPDAFGACLMMKNIGKPCAGKPHARFDEGRVVHSSRLLYLIPPMNQPCVGA